MDNDENKLPIEPSELTNNKPPELPPTPTHFEGWGKERESKLNSLSFLGLMLTLIGFISSIIMCILFALDHGDFLSVLLVAFLVSDLIGIGFIIAAFTTKTGKKIVWAYFSAIFGILFGFVLGIIGGIILIYVDMSYRKTRKY